MRVSRGSSLTTSQAGLETKTMSTIVLASSPEHRSFAIPLKFFLHGISRVLGCLPSLLNVLSHTMNGVAGRNSETP